MTKCATYKMQATGKKEYRIQAVPNNKAIQPGGDEYKIQEKKKDQKENEGGTDWSL